MIVRAGVNATEEMKVFSKHTGRGWAGERGNPMLDILGSTCSKYVAKFI